MEEEKGFYKLETGGKRSVVLHGTNISNKDYNLAIENKDTHTYPVDGWTYFDTFEEATTFFNVTAEEKELFKEDLFPSGEII